MMGLDVNAEHFRARVLQDAINYGMAATWERRAALFEAALPRPGDFRGHQQTRERQAEKVRELIDIVTACRARAQAARAHDRIDADVAAVVPEKGVQASHTPGGEVAA
ncbi:hypothetical protein ACOACO_18385 [Nocardioides sp. CPCC 205120]|uniref:hypothetical protein n=1 Tax=Nocardioides sp. CPCC 205120 TaxID=3406462 RepID=UPI003B5093EA